MYTTKEQLKAIFAGKVPALVAALEAWFEEEIEAIDGSIEVGAPSGSGSSILAMRPAIDSKRVLDATAVTKKVLEIELPPEIINPAVTTVAPRWSPTSSLNWRRSSSATSR